MQNNEENEQNKKEMMERIVIKILFISALGLLIHGAIKLSSY